MNILFISLSDFSKGLEGIYGELMECFAEHGHKVTVVCPVQRRLGIETSLMSKQGIEILAVRTLNITGKCSLLEKGMGTVLVGHQFLTAVKRYLADRQVDLILYATPPVTIAPLVEKLKAWYRCKTYLLLKDIFPQNAVDLGMFSKKSPLYLYFKHLERRLYQVSDHIGCMSQANVDYILKHEPYLSADRVEINPNSRKLVKIERQPKIREKYGIPTDRIVLIYGGNFGKPQGVDFIAKCLDVIEQRSEVFCVLVGSGKEAGKIEQTIKDKRLQNTKFLPRLPKDEFEALCAASDLGLVFLDHRFTIPNFPSRTLSYMAVGLPYLACVDRVSDIGTLAEANGFGVNCYSGDVGFFALALDQFISGVKRNSEYLQEKGRKAYRYFIENYLVDGSYQIICSHAERN